VTNDQTLVDFGLRIADTAGALYKHTASHLAPRWVHWDTILQLRLGWKVL
jgi:hypothetical protein